MVHNSLFMLLFLACFVRLSLCYPVDSDLGSGSGAGSSTGDHRPPHPKVTIPCKPKVVDHSRGVYMHAHPNYPNLPGAPGGAFHAQYMHSAGGIGKGRKRSLRESMMRLFKIRTH
ncbi:uncharacterized protein LOC116301476 isoform X2 [Actinia tenebrosa]|nr:uncharacterized protein LOC116301476 isoform X2 [Actinia tenebrosa]